VSKFVVILHVYGFPWNKASLHLKEANLYVLSAALSIQVQALNKKTCKSFKTVYSVAAGSFLLQIYHILKIKKMTFMCNHILSAFDQIFENSNTLSSLATRKSNIYTYTRV
jgi:hypothetical protein